MTRPLLLDFVGPSASRLVADARDASHSQVTEHPVLPPLGRAHHALPALDAPRAGRRGGQGLNGREALFQRLQPSGHFAQPFPQRDHIEVFFDV